MSNFRNLIESIIFEAASDNVKERLLKKYMTGDPNIDAHRDYYSNSIDLIHDHHLPDSNKSQADLEWMSDRHFSGDSSFSIHDNVSNKHLLTEFNKPAIKDKMQKKKLNQYKSWGEFEEAINPHLGTAKTEKEKADADTKVIFKNDTHIVRQHNTQESMVQAAKLQKDNPHFEDCGGKATWCVSVEGERGKNYFDDYTKGGKHPFYTIEHTDKHPTDPNRKFAVLADPNRSFDHDYSSGIEFRNEKQNHGWEIGYMVSKQNSGILNTPPMKYISDKMGYKGNGQFSNTNRDDITNIKHYNEEGKLHGNVMEKNRDGKVLTSFNYENGKKVGASQELTWDGHIEKGNYLDDRRHGTFKKYHSKTNALLSETPFVHGDEHGLQIEYEHDENNGKTRKIREREYDLGFIKDQKDFRNGILMSHQQAGLDGSRDDKTYSTGSKLITTFQKDSSGNEKYKEFFHDKGQVSHESNYDKKTNTRESKDYDETGFVTSHTVFNSSGKTTHEYEKGNPNPIKTHIEDDKSDWNRTTHEYEKGNPHPIKTTKRKSDNDTSKKEIFYHKGTNIPSKEVETSNVFGSTSYKRTHYSKEGKPTHFISGDDYGRKFNEVFYHKNGNPKRKIRYVPSQEGYDTVKGFESEFSEDGKIARETVHDHEGKPKEINHFDSDGNVIKSVKLTESKSAFRKLIEGK